MTISYSEYYKEIESIAKDLADGALEATEGDRDQAIDKINDYMLHEFIDGHQWVIYYSNNLDVIKHSDNDDYMIDNFGTEEAVYALKERGLSGLHTAIAYWCMYADVQEKIDEALDTILEEWEEKEV